jgi:hypothetical protein
MEFAAQRIDLALRMKWNIGFWIAGAVFWTYAAIVGATFPLAMAKNLWLGGVFFIVPAAVLASKLVGADIEKRGNSLAMLVGLAHVTVLAMSFPLIIAAFFYFPDGMILAMALCFGLDFFVHSWAYATPIPAGHGVVRTVLVTAIWFARPDWRATLLPATVALCYFVTVLLILVERPRWLERHQMVAAHEA